MTEISAPTYPLSPSAFERSVRRGLGRAILHVRRHGASGLEEIVIAACVREDTYDRQIEARAAYLDELLDAAALGDLAVPTLAETLAAASWEREPSSQQASDLLLLLARRGRDDASAALRAAFEDPAQRRMVLDAQIHVDGAGGLQRVARALGAEVRAGEPVPDFLAGPLREAEELLGEEAAARILSNLALRDDDARAYREAVLRDRERTRRWLAEPTPVPTLDEVRDAETSESPGRMTLRRFGRGATDAQIEGLLDELHAETATDLVERYLHVLARRGLPRFHERVLQLARDAAPRFRHLAVLALQTVTDERVREFALDALSTRPREALLDEVPILLSANYRAGDQRVLEQSLDAEIASFDDKDMHRVCFGLHSLLTAQPLGEFLPVALWTYEHTPCASCRGYVIRILRKLDGTPAWVRDEIPLDSTELERAAEESTEDDAD